MHFKLWTTYAETQERVVVRRALTAGLFKVADTGPLCEANTANSCSVVGARGLIFNELDGGVMKVLLAKQESG